jgi:putative lipoprotein
VRPLLLLALAGLGAIACARAQEGEAGTPAPPIAVLTGTVTYRERMALPEGAVVRVELRDVSRADASAPLLATQEIRPTTQVPIAFELRYDPARIDPRHTYAVSARIEVDGTLWWINDTQHQVLTGGNPDRVEVVVRRVPG